MKKIKASIIIPIFNCEKYLEQSLITVLNQSEKNIEIICINDGSTDSTKDVLMKFKDKRIKIIDQSNSGPAKARLRGINEAKGEYICFMDSDDTVEPDFIKKMIKKAKEKNFDVVVCGYKRVYEIEKNKYSREMLNRKDIFELSNKWNEVVTINSAVWNKLYKTDVVKDIINIADYPKIAEDAIFFLQVLLNTNSIGFVNEILYNYFVHSDGLSSKISETDIKKMENALLEVKMQFIHSDKNKILNTFVFLHFGVFFTFKINLNPCLSINQYGKEIITFLDHNFNEWKNIELNEFLYIGILKINFLKIIYKYNLYILFLKIYKLFNFRKGQVKW